MSLRIHKVIGYGLKDVKIANNKIIDERFESSGYFLHQNQQNKYHLQNFWDKLMEKDAEKWMVDLYSMDFYVPHLSECAHFGNIDNTGVVVVCPPNKSHCWQRIDDVIDYCDTINTHGYKPYTMSFTSGIPSYNFLMDKTTGRKLPTTDARELMSLISRYKQATEAEKLSLESTMAELASDIGFDNIDDAEQNMVAMVPEIVAEFCSFLKMFKDPSTVWTMQPMMYVYWR